MQPWTTPRESSTTGTASPAPCSTALTPRLADPALFTALCSEQQFSYEGHFGGVRRIIHEGVDLRGAEIVVGAEADGLVNVVLRQGDRRHACDLAPQDTDFGVSRTYLLADDVADPGTWNPFGSIIASGAGGKSIVPGDHAYYLCSHQAPGGVRSIEVSGQVEGTVEVGEDGLFACVLKGDAADGIAETSWVAKDADGEVVAEGTVS